MKKIIILCPGNVITGGVNSLHNLCSSLTRCGFDAAMYYFDVDEKVIENQQIKSYGVKVYSGKLDLPDQLIIVSETMVEQLTEFLEAKKAVYWLALKYYFKNPPWKFPFNVSIIRKLISCRSYFGYSGSIVESLKRRLNDYAKSKNNIWSKDYLHISNSYHVADYCKKRGASNVFVIHNPIRNEFYETDKSLISKTNTIIFGPKTSKLLVNISKLFLKGYKIVQIKHFSLDEVFKLMSQSVVFAEFGNNPGRDRMPREAVMLGCIVFLNTRGSSSDKRDYDIKENYKIVDRLVNYPKIIKRIKKAADNYSKYIDDFDEFRHQLASEKSNFDNTVKFTFNKIANDSLKS